MKAPDLQLTELCAFRCPFCQAHVKVGETETSPAVVHALPTCVVFDTHDILQYLQAVRRKMDEKLVS